MTMGIQRFYLPSGNEYIEYSVEDVECDYANVVIAPIDETLVVGIGYVLREEVTVGISLDTDAATTVKRWFAYDAGSCGGAPGSRVGNVNAGYATMEGAINGLLGKYADVAEAVTMDCSESADAYIADYDAYGGYDEHPLEIDVWTETDPTGILNQSVIAEINQAGGIHVLTANFMREVTEEVAKTLWTNRSILERDGARMLMSIGVDTPQDGFGNHVVDTIKPFDGMTLNLVLKPSGHSAAPLSSVSISIIDVENANDANVMVGTSMVNGRESGDTEIGKGLAVGVDIDSLASEAATHEDVKTFVDRIMSVFFNNLMRRMIMEYQSMVGFLDEISEWSSESLTEYAMTMR